MLVNLSRHAKKCSVILAIEKIKIRTVGNSNANNPGYEKILHIRLRLEPSHCFHNALSVCHRIGSIRQSVANATQVEALAKLRRGGTQKVRVEHVHVYPGGQAIVGNVNQTRGRGEQSKMSNNPMQRATKEPLPLRKSPRCGARTRTGQPCQSPNVKGKKRCRMPGGAHGSGAPKGSRNGNYRHGRRTAEAIAQRRALMAFIREARQHVARICEPYNR